MSKPKAAAIRAAVPLSALPTWRPDPRVCSVCGVEVDPDDLPCEAWIEHDERDRPIADKLVFLGRGIPHAACVKALNDHPRLYAKRTGHPGAFPALCGPCVHRRDLGCAHADLRANGGAGLLVNLSTGLPRGVILCGRGGRIQPVANAVTCAGRLVAS